MVASDRLCRRHHFSIDPNPGSPIFKAGLDQGRPKFKADPNSRQTRTIGETRDR